MINCCPATTQTTTKTTTTTVTTDPDATTTTITTTTWVDSGTYMWDSEPTSENDRSVECGAEFDDVWITITSAEGCAIAAEWLQKKYGDSSKSTVGTVMPMKYAGEVKSTWQPWLVKLVCARRRMNERLRPLPFLSFSFFFFPLLLFNVCLPV